MRASASLSGASDASPKFYFPQTFSILNTQSIVLLVMSLCINTSSLRAEIRALQSRIQPDHQPDVIDGIVWPPPHVVCPIFNWFGSGVGLVFFIYKVKCSHRVGTVYPTLHSRVEGDYLGTVVIKKLTNNFLSSTVNINWRLKRQYSSAASHVCCLWS